MSRYLPILFIIFFSLISCEKDPPSLRENNAEDDKKTEHNIDIKMVLVEGGTFPMGCSADTNNCFDDEKPLHTVFLMGFYLSKYEITNKQFAQFMNEVNALPDGTHEGSLYLDMDDYHCQIQYADDNFLPVKGKENYPVIEVTWFGAKAFCEFYGGRLPTEAEWEYAARGGKESEGYIYSGSDTLYKVGWYYNNSYYFENRYHDVFTHEVGTKNPNELGIYDMSGNVFEWCNDWYSSTYYEESPMVNPPGPSEGIYRVGRGGCWSYDAEHCRLTYRLKNGYPSGSGLGMGFRFCKNK